jgi:hypothetical protein
MKTLSRLWIGSLAIALLFALGCGPIGPVPGGRLSGQVESSAPTDWSFTDAYDTVQLETGGSDPYSVNVWATSIGGELFIAAGTGAGTKWARNIEADPDVRLRVDDRVYELRAIRVELTPEVQDRFLSAIEKKYDFERDDEDTNEAWLYRLAGR